MSKTTILTGLRANNDLHIGNYFGALLPLIDMAKTHADEYDINLFVPDLHSFTTPIDHSKLQEQIRHNLRLFVAAGLPLDHDSIHIYRQSYVPAHSELTWILDCFTGFGEISRMTQFKDKSKKLEDSETRALDYMKQFSDISNEKYWELKMKFLDIIVHENESRTSVGLFNYPILMAADILLYSAELVPVGDDQTQHLEFARDIAERMNSRFGELFVVPKPVKEQHDFFGKDQGLRIRDLQNPSKKMSKSEESGKGIIFLGDEPESAAKKIMGAETDSLAKIPSQLDYENQPGVSNLLQILALLQNKPVEGVISNYAGQEQYGPLKTKAAEAVKDFLADFQGKLSQVDEQALMQKLENDEKKMNEVANATLYKVQKAIGLR